MNDKISVFVICVEAIIYLLFCHLHDCTFKKNISSSETTVASTGKNESVIRNTL